MENNYACRVKLQQDGKSKSEIERAVAVGDLHRKLSYVGLENLKTMVRHKVIRDCDLSVGDVEFYAKHMHSKLCKGCALGKTIQYPAVSKAVTNKKNW
jgi:hypothetical protein